MAIALPVSLNTLAVVGTANRGVLDTPTLITGIQQAYNTFGYPDAFDSTTEMQELSLTRAIQLAFDGGASNIYAVRVAASSAASATRDVQSTSGDCVILTAASEGTWGNDLQFKIEIADGDTATTGHVAQHFGFVEDTYTDALTASSPFDYLDIATAVNYYAEENAGNSVQVIYDSGTGTAVDMTIIHSDAHALKETADVPGEPLSTTAMWCSQTFTTLDACTIEGVRIRMAEDATGLTGDVTVALRAVDTATGKPTGAHLASVSVSDTTLALSTSYSTEVFTFSATYDLVADTKYAIVIYCDTISAGIVYVGGLTADGTDTYTKGDGWYSSNSGTDWGASTFVEDYMFDIIITIPEAHCEFVVNNWDTAWPGGEYKHIRWSGDSTPTDTTHANIGYYTASSRKLTVKYGTLEEYFWVVDGTDMVADVNAGSALVTATADTNVTEEPLITTGFQQFGVGAGTTGNSGAADVSAGDYDAGWTALELFNVHVLTAAGRSDRATISAMTAHCENMANKKKERVAVAGHAFDKTLAQVLQSSGPYASKRLAFVSPGIDRANVSTGLVEDLPASYTAAYFAGQLCKGDVSESNLFKTLSVAGLETLYSEGELEQIVQRRIIPASEMAEGGYRWRESINTSSDSEWREITTVRITDYATFGLRSICNQFIGRKNLGGARSAIANAVIGFFETMKNSEMLSDSMPSYTVSVTSTEQQQAAGIVQVTVTFKPVKAIKYITIIEYIE